MIPGSPSPLFFSTPNYTVNNSLRFRNSASAALNFTNAGASSDRKKFTVAFWLKRSLLTGRYMIYSVNSGGTNGPTSQCTMGFEGAGVNGDTLNYNNGSVNITTTSIFRDINGWLHFCQVFDTTQAVAADRVKTYINGVLITDLNIGAQFSLNDNTAFGQASVTQYIGRRDSGLYYDGYMAEIYWIDGQALSPTSFCAYDNTTGVLVPTKYTGTYGSNGFYLNFSNATSTTTIAKDYSGNGNNWTATNISVTAGSTFDQMIDVPLNSTNGVNNRGNYPILSSYTSGFVGTISNGGLEYTRGSTAAHGSVSATFALPTTGKWYWEVTACSSTNNEVIGVADLKNNPQLPASGTELGGRSGDYMYRSSAASVSGGTTVAYGASYTSGDVISVLWNSDAGSIEFYKNGISQGTAYTGIVQALGRYFPAASSAETSLTDKFNFGQRAFAYTVPAGYKALNSFNLPFPTIPNGAKYFMANTYSGTAAIQSVNNGSFLPDLVWTKNRSISQIGTFADVMRRANVLLDMSTATGGAEVTAVNSVISFDSTGYTIGGNVFVNQTTNNYVSWTFSAGSNSSTLYNIDNGNTKANVNPGITQGISIMTYTGKGANVGVPHGLGVTPSFIIVRQRNGTGAAQVWHSAISANQYLSFASTAANTSDSTMWNNTAFTSANISLGTSTSVNGGAGRIYAAWYFAEVPGFSSFGTYIGNASGDGPVVYLGFRPRLILIKSLTTTGSWCIFDTARDPYNAVQGLLITASNSENRTTGRIDIYANGFKIRETSTNDNGSGTTYAYIAFAENPFNYSLAR